MEESAETLQVDYIELAAEIASAYVSNNSVPVTELPALLGGIHAALAGLASVAPASEQNQKLTSAQIKKSVTHDALVSFEDGKPYKTLRRHLTIRGLTPEAYRMKWGLPVDYPMVAASYSEQRSSLAKSLGLGQQRRKSAPEPAPEAGAAKPAAAPAKPAAASAKPASAKPAAAKSAVAKSPASAKPARKGAARTETAGQADEAPAPKSRGRRKPAVA